MISKILHAGLVVLMTVASASAGECEYRGGDGITARASADGGYDIGYGLTGFADPATDDHCRIASVEGGRQVTCEQGFTGPYIEAGSTIEATDDAIIVLLNSVLYKVCS